MRLRCCTVKGESSPAARKVLNAAREYLHKDIDELSVAYINIQLDIPDVRGIQERLKALNGGIHTQSRPQGNAPIIKKGSFTHKKTIPRNLQNHRRTSS